MSKALPDPPSKGPHQSLTSTLPVKAWQMTVALSFCGDSFPHVEYASGALSNVSPDSRVNEGFIAIFWFGIKARKGFSSCCRVLSWLYSVKTLSFWRGKRGGTDHI